MVCRPTLFETACKSIERNGLFPVGRLLGFDFAKDDFILGNVDNEDKLLGVFNDNNKDNIKNENYYTNQTVWPN